MQPQPSTRILSIDAFRGITIFVMVFVNELAGVRDIPVWMKHMPADADAMTFVDLVFPAFLFIVGMSIPFALKNRIKKGDGFWQLQWHIIWRTLGLLVLGIFMVNGEGGVNEELTGMNEHWWSLLFYAFAIMVWNVYSFDKKWLAYVFRGIGIAGLCWLAYIYRSGDGDIMKPHWWGILGLIGWAYLYACIIYQLLKGNWYLLVFAVAACVGMSIVVKLGKIPDVAALNWIKSQGGNFAHASIVLCGVVLSQIFFAEKNQALKKQLLNAALFAAICFVAGYLLRPAFKISKIYATPTWCLYSAAICMVLFAFLYWLIDKKKIQGWTKFFEAAATNPLLTYIIPGILYAIMSIIHFYVLPSEWRYGIPGIIWCLLYAVAVMYIAKGLNKLRIRMQL